MQPLPPTPSPARKRLRLVWKVLRYLLLGFTGLLLTLIILAYVFEDKIKNYAVQHLNQYLNTEIKVESIDLSLLRKFPSASLVFHNVYVQDPLTVQKERDTMLYARRIYLEFSIWDLFSDKISIKKVEVDHSRIKLFVDALGNENYVIWKPSTDTVPASDNFAFALEKVEFKNCHLDYTNRIIQHEQSYTLRELSFSGEFYREQFILNTAAKGQVHYLMDQGLTLLREKKINLSSTLEVDRTQQRYTFREGKLELEDLRFAIAGTFRTEEGKTETNLSLSGDNIQVESLLKSFPALSDNDLRGYETRGALKFDASVKGMWSKTETPDMQASFSIDNGYLREKSSGEALQELQFSGSYTNRNKKGREELWLREIKGRFRNELFSAQLLFTDFSSPLLEASVKGNFNLANVQDFFRFQAIDSVSGRLSLEASASIRFRHDAGTGKWDSEIGNASGKANLQSLNLVLRDRPMRWRNVSGNFSLRDQNALVENFTASVGKSDIALQGALYNVLPFILRKGEKLSIVAELKSNLLDMGDLLKPAKSANPFDTTSGVFVWPDNVNFNLDAYISDLRFDEFRATQASGNFKLLDKNFKASRLRLQTAGGQCRGEVEINGTRADLFGMSATLDIEDMQVAEVFRQFRNFGQKMIRYDHLRGKISAHIQFAAALDPHLRIDPQKIGSLIDLTIRDGELVGLEAMREISNYLRKDKRTRLLLGSHIDDLERRLSHIRFSTLSNTLEIREGKVQIPAMEIVSTAMTINVSAVHSFRNEIDYRFNFRLLELKARHQETEYGTIADDGTGIRIFVRMFGTIDKPQFEQDAETRKAERKKYNEAEKKQIKAILREELGLFKKDTTLKLEPTPKEEVKFLLEWDEEKPAADPVSPSGSVQPEKPRNKNRFEKLKHKLGVEEEKPKSTVILEE